MDDARVWGSEEGLWTADAERYAATIDPACLMVLPEKPWIFSGEAAVDEVSRTPRWTNVAFSGQQVSRPQDGLIVVAYRVTASRGSERYAALCSTAYRRLGHDDWRVIQHQQFPIPTAAV